MAQLILSEVGGYVGSQLLPQGVSVLGQQISGQAIGGFIGSAAGSAIDAYLFAPRYEGPRISQLHVTQSVEGAPIPNVYGRMRLGCNVIWAARFQEKSDKSGKGGPKTTTYSYSLSFAVGLCEGEVSRISRAWANGAAFDLSSVNWRLYRGGEDQAPDSLIEAIEGYGQAPAYKGLAYIVFEDLPLDDFGGRIPQLSFEVVRPVGGADRMETAVSAMNLIPGSGEFAYASEIIRREVRLGVEEPENMHNGAGVADFVASLDQLVEDFPNLSHVNLIVGWFGTSTDCAQCEIRPGVELRGRKTRPRSWTVAGLDRESAYLISADEEGRPSYGGTPDDQSVIQAIQALKARGLKVTLYPFLFMDAPGFPWRGRVTCSPEIYGSSAASDAVAAFFGTDMQWRYNRFIKHYAWLAGQAGGVDAFLIGSEMVGLTRIRSAPSVYPAVAHLKTLAGELRALLGAGTDISYSADWTEYGAYLPQDGSNDVDFPLDDLWADANIDFIGLDWYAPMGDWRDSADHLDAMAGWTANDDPAYLQSQIEGGEGYDFYYASQSDRDQQIRTPIIDTAHGEDWIFRQKDIRSWWETAHYPRSAGARASTSTAWAPGSKPVRFIEFGYPAVDKGANQPNVFYDPKSDESALPHYSSGARDDIVQRRAIEAFCRHWRDEPMLASGGIGLWAWDMRPFPAWPLNTELWSDGGNWRLGHWLNGRVGLALLPDVVADLSDRAGVAMDVSGLNGLVTGFALNGVMSMRDALEPLRTAFDVRTIERETGLIFLNSEPELIALSSDDLVMPEAGEPVELTRAGMEPAAPFRIRLSFIDSEADGQPGVALSMGEADAPVRDASLALVLDRDQAQRLADDLAARAFAAQRTGVFSMSPARLDLEPGDVVAVDSETLQVLSITETGPRRIEALKRIEAAAVLRAGAAPSSPDISRSGGLPVVAIVDAPPLPGEEDDARPLVFAAASPWAGTVAVEAGVNASSLSTRCTITTPCVMGALLSDAPAGVAWRWSPGDFVVQLIEGGLSSAEEIAVLNGANAGLIETPEGWELFQHQSAELIGDHVWRLSGLLRGQQGSEHLLGLFPSAGARVVFFTGAEQRLSMNARDYDLPLVWRAQAAGADANATAEGVFASARVALRQWAPALLRVQTDADGLDISWIRRGRRGGDGWEAGEPLLDAAERYRLEAWVGEETRLTLETTTPSARISSAELSRLGSAFELRVAQLGPDGTAGSWSRLSVTNSP